jgi:hypothetical protein
MLNLQHSQMIYLQPFFCDSVLHSLHLILCADNIYYIPVKTTLFPADGVAVSNDIVTIKGV